MTFFSISKNGFRSSWSTSDLLAIASDRIARFFNKSRATWAVALAISEAFYRVWHAGHLRVVLDGKSSQKYPVKARFPQGSFYGPILAPFLVINNLFDDTICDIAGFNSAFQKWLLSFFQWK